MNKGAKLLNELYKELYLEQTTNNHTNISDKPVDKINKYLIRLEKAHETKRKRELLKQFYYKKYAIKEQDIKDTYYEHLDQVNLEKGLGHINMTKEGKKQIANEIIKSQEKSLNTWIDYLSSDNTKYPTWAKYWAFRGMLSLGEYKNSKYNKRSKTTTHIFAELNKDALDITMDCMINYLYDNKETTDIELNNLLNNKNFGKLYEYTFNKLKKKNTINNEEGIWIKYDKGSDYMEIVNSINGYKTGWCIASEEIAKNYLSDYDIHIYYSNDLNNKPTIPRIAIKTKEFQIMEIRGIAEEQNVEQEMEKVVKNKLEEFPLKDEYMEKTLELEKLGNIYTKYKEDTITKEDLKYLYEIDKEIQFFGYDKDPRIEEIINTRDKKKDLAWIFDCKETEIGINKEDIFKNKTIYYYNSLMINKQDLINIVFPNIIKGGLYFNDDVKDIQNIVLPEIVHNTLTLDCLDILENTILPKEVSRLRLNNVVEIRNAILPKIVHSITSLDNVISIENAIMPKIAGDIYLRKLKEVKNCICTYSNRNNLICSEEIKQQFTYIDDKEYEELEDIKNYSKIKPIQF